MVKRLLILAILFLVGIAGCYPRSSAGPFITDISYDGEGNLIVTKNMVFFERGFWGDMAMNIGENPQTVVIKATRKEPPTSK